MTKTVGGTCGTSGFMDGPLGVNKLSSPDMVGVDTLGNIFVMDSGNKYIRMISTKGRMYTLIQGACFATGRVRAVTSIEIPEAICYRSWIKTSGEPSSHIYVETNIDNSTICVKHITQCDGYTHPLFRTTE